MPLKSEINEAVSVLEQLQTALVKCDDPRTRVRCHDDLNAIMCMLKNPMLNKIVAIQEALQTLRAKVAHHPSLLPEDFDISADGKLIHASSVDDGEESFVPIQDPVVVSTKTSIDSQSHFSIANDDEFSSSNSIENRKLESLRTASVSSPQKQPTEEVPDPTNYLISSNELKSFVERSAEDKEVIHVRLSKPEGTNLGFSVVGLQSELRGDLGIYIKDIQQSGIAGQDGRLQDGDQILAIDGKIIDAFISHQNAISILQNASNIIDLYVARDPSAQAENEINSKNLENQSKLLPFSNTHIVPPSTESHTSNMLNTEWAQVEVIYLVNDGTGLGFGIIGGRSTGVVVKTILPGGVAYRDNRLQACDHILQIGDVNLRGLGSDQVASVLRQAGAHVRLVVARPVESASAEFQVDRVVPVVETRVLNDPEELERHLISYGDPSAASFLRGILPSAASAGSLSNGHSDLNFMNGDTELLTVAGDGTIRLQECIPGKAFALRKADSLTKERALRSMHSSMSADSMHAGQHGSQDITDEEERLLAVVQGGEGLSLSDLPEMESIEVLITKDYHGLGITIAGYVCEREELSGIFVKSVNAGSAADRSQQIQVNDQIVEVDGHSLSGMSNHAAVEVLKATTKEVRLKLIRYLRGPKFEQLQQAIANSEMKTTPSTPNPARSSVGDLANCDALRTALIGLEDEDESLSQEKSLAEVEQVVEDPVTISPPTKYTTSSEIRMEDIELMIDNDFCGRLKPSVESAIQRKWSNIIGDETDIVVAQLTKFEKGGGLGISLEGTVDVEDGKEVRPHHYIRSILPEGPVGKESSLKSGDELLEVNNRKLFGLNHLEVVAILKELPQSVRLVCGRRKTVSSLHPIDAPTADRDTFAARNILGGSLQNLLPANDRLVKAKSDGSLASSVAANSDSNSFTKIKSRSLEPLSGLAMWSTEFQEIELVKGERGLGFSILDYQDPINPHDTVIVIRSLVPGGVAEKDGCLIPGDRLIAVNGISLENASLDTAVAALKGAPKGLVQIAVAKPVSVLESPGQLDLIIGSQRSDNDSEYTDDSEFLHSDSNDVSRETADGSTVRRQSTNVSTDSPDVTLTKPPVPTARTSLDRPSSLIGAVATERLIGGNNEYSVESRKENSTDATKRRSSRIQKSASDSFSEDDIEDEDYNTQRRNSSNSYINLQNTIVFKKDTDHIGISYEFDNEMNGIIINSIREDGAVFKDGRLCTGDLIVAVGDACLANRTDHEIKTILKSSQLDKEISITFVSRAEALHYRELVRIDGIQGALETETLVDISSGNKQGGDIPKDIREAPQESRPYKSPATTESSEEDPFLITFRNLPEAGSEICLSEKSLCDELSRNKTVSDRLVFESDRLLEHSDTECFPEISGNVYDLGYQSATNPVSTLSFFSTTNISPCKTSSSLSELKHSHQSGATGVPRCSSLWVCSDPHDNVGVSTEDKLSPKLVVAHITDLNSLVHTSEFSSTQSLEAPVKASYNYFLRQYSELINDPVDIFSDSECIESLNQIDNEPTSQVLNRENEVIFDDSLLISTSNRTGKSYRIDLNGDSKDCNVITEENLSAPDLLNDLDKFCSMMTITQNASEEVTDAISKENSSAFEGKHWGPERRVDVKRDENGSLGISIVGGKVDLAWNESSVSGIFIKNVLANSPAGKSALLQTGDRILEVEGTDLRNAPHEKAVEVIKKTGNPVCFVVQSLIQWAPLNPLPTSRDISRSTNHPESVAAVRMPSPELIQVGLTDEAKQEMLRKADKVKSLDNEGVRERDNNNALQGRVMTAGGKMINRNSAGAMVLTEEEAAEETEDKFGYTKKKIQKKYARLEGEVILINLLKEENGVGITLSGHKDRTQMAAFVCGINPSGSAYKDDRLKVGDEILEVNGNVLQGISHLNASKIFRQIPGPAVNIVIRRTAKCLEEMAVKPITQFPVSLEDESPEEKYSRFNGLAKFVLNKGQSGLGIMIIEGKHAEYGKGIFISDLQEGSIAAEAGLLVGDMILCVNKEDMVGINYEEATNIVKRLDGIITMWVANATRIKPISATDSSRPQSRTADLPRLQSRATDSKKPDLLPKPVLPPKPQSLKKTPSNSSSINNTTDHSPRTGFGYYTSTESTFASNNHGNLPTAVFTEEQTEIADPHTADIIPSKETIIEIIKEKMGLGLSIVGGSDTLLGAIIIHEVYPDGAASKDGRLNPGDQILEVNNENFRVITHQKALNVLRQTPSKVKMVVYREETAKEENLYDIIDVQLTKKSGKGLGLSIVGRKNGKGVFISDLVPGGVAESDGRLMQGDQILEVNDNDLRNATQEQAAAILKCAPGYVSMKIGRLKPGKNVSLHASNATWPVTISDDSPRNSVNLADAKYTNVPLPQQDLASGPFPIDEGPKAPIRKLLLDRGEDGLGFSIVGGYGSNLGDLPIYVKSVFEKGAASKERSLRRGDQIIEVNGLSLNGLSHAQAVAILKESRGTVILTVLPSK